MWKYIVSECNLELSLMSVDAYWTVYSQYSTHMRAKYTAVIKSTIVFVHCSAVIIEVTEDFPVFTSSGKSYILIKNCAWMRR